MASELDGEPVCLHDIDKVVFLMHVNKLLEQQIIFLY